MLLVLDEARVVDKKKQLQKGVLSVRKKALEDRKDVDRYAVCSEKANQEESWNVCCCSSMREQHNCLSLFHMRATFE